MQTYRTVINRPNRLGVFAGLTGLLLTSGLLLSFAAYGETMEEKLQAQIQQEKQEQAAAEEKRKQAEVAKQKADKEAAEKAAAAKAAAEKEKERKAAAEKKLNNIYKIFEEGEADEFDRQRLNQIKDLLPNGI